MTTQEKIQALLVAAHELVEQARLLAAADGRTISFRGETIYPDDGPADDPDVWQSSWSPGC